jgi:hypothetical protein
MPPRPSDKCRLEASCNISQRRRKFAGKQVVLICNGGKNFSTWDEIRFKGAAFLLKYDDSGALRLGGNTEHKAGGGCMRSIQCNIDFLYKVCICSRAEKNNEKPLSLRKITESLHR